MLPPASFPWRWAVLWRPPPRAGQPPSVPPSFPPSLPQPPSSSACPHGPLLLGAAAGRGGRLHRGPAHPGQQPPVQVRGRRLPTPSLPARPGSSRPSAPLFGLQGPKSALWQPFSHILYPASSIPQPTTCTLQPPSCPLCLTFRTPHPTAFSLNLSPLFLPH